MAPPNRGDAGKNWTSLKSELFKTKTVSSSTSKTVIQKKTTIKLSKKKRKDTRQTIQQEANRLIAAKAESSKPLTLLPVAHVTQVVGLDCEYVGVGFNGSEDQIARVSIVNEKGETLYDKYVKPMEPVTDYRTHVSGVQPGHLLKGISFAQAQDEVSKLLANKIVVGHAIHNDFRVLKLSHPFRLVRDTAKYKPFREALQIGGAPSLKVLAEKLLGIRIQEGEHSSLIDARTALRLYLLNRKKWDAQIKQAKRHITQF